MAGRVCYHCKQWVAAGEAHDCWTTTEAALTAELSDDLRDAWDRVRETAVDFGDQRIYASHNSIMFSRKSCYFFVRPKKSWLEVCVFLGRPLTAPQVRRSLPSSRSKFANIVRIRHRDEVEAPITDWLREAYDYAGSGAPVDAPARRVGSSGPSKSADQPRKKSARRATVRARETKRPSRTKRTKRQ